MTQAQRRLIEIRTQLKTEPVRPWRSLLRAAGLAFLLFNLAAGFVMVTMPLVELAAINLWYKLWVPLQRWLWQEPTFGGQLGLITNLVVAAVLLWLARDVLRLWVLQAWVWLSRLGRKGKPTHAEARAFLRVRDGPGEEPSLEGIALT